MLTETSEFEIIPIEKLASPNFGTYNTRLERLWRGLDPYHGSKIRDADRMSIQEIFEFIGFVAYIALERPYARDLTKPRVKMNWFAKLGEKPKLNCIQEAEDILSFHYTCRLWKTYIKGQRHDYYFYSKFQSIEECLNLLDVCMIMDT